MRRWPRIVLVIGALAGVAYAYWKLAVPKHRVDIRSELVMLGDVDGDGAWTEGDLRVLDAFLEDPFGAPTRSRGGSTSTGMASSTRRT